ncbi:MAG TPA: isoprenylcysteine carboxylmethyltransferase family protein [Stenomitos sp.]
MVFKAFLALATNFIIFGGLLFLPAGTLDWWRAWVFVGVIVISAIATVVTVFRADDALWNERLKPPIQEGQPLPDKIITVLFLAAFLALIVSIPLDVFRYHLLGKPNAIIAGVGLFLFVAGWLMVSLSFKANTFAAPVVKYQAERQQTVIDTGVYGIVRHPMYAGAVLLMIGMPLWLESYAAVGWAIVPTALLAVRILIEEQFLRQALEGYTAYTQRVRYRLLPYVW